VTRPRILELFCGAGGSGVGYHRAGFDVVGVDIKPQPKYPFQFHRGDARDMLGSVIERQARSGANLFLGHIDAIHASPPCQVFTALKHMPDAKHHEDLLTPIRMLLIESGLPYVIENVEGAPMNGSHVTLCGSVFGLGTDGAELRRHRHFEANFPIMCSPCQHGREERVIGVYGGHGRDRRRRTNGQDFPTSARREAMGIDWMTGAELSQAIPPAYTEHVGGYLMAEVERRARLAA
jgi:DNA (cytosine-5)-methyltransferase 1